MSDVTRSPSRRLTATLGKLGKSASLSVMHRSSGSSGGGGGRSRLSTFISPRESKAEKPEWERNEREFDRKTRDPTRTDKVKELIGLRRRTSSTSLGGSAIGSFDASATQPRPPAPSASGDDDDSDDSSSSNSARSEMVGVHDRGPRKFSKGRRHKRPTMRLLPRSESHRSVAPPPPEDQMMSALHDKLQGSRLQYVRLQHGSTLERARGQNVSDAVARVLIHTEPKLMDIRAILLTYHKTTSTRDLIGYVVQAYITQSADPVVLDRVCTFVRVWLEERGRIDFIDPNVALMMITMLLGPLAAVRQRDVFFTTHAAALSRISEDPRAWDGFEVDGVTSGVWMPQPVCVPLVQPDIVDPYVLAYHLSVVEHAKFLRMTPIGLQYYESGKKMTVERAGRIIDGCRAGDSMGDEYKSQLASLFTAAVGAVSDSIVHTTNLSAWVATAVLTRPQEDARLRAITRTIDTIGFLMSMRNFNTAAALMTGLGMTPVQRLKTTWARVPTAQRNVIAAALSVFGMDNNYAVCRSMQARRMPCLPFLPMLLRDITFIKDGNPDYVNGLPEPVVDGPNFMDVIESHAARISGRSVESLSPRTMEPVRPPSPIDGAAECAHTDEPDTKRNATRIAAEQVSKILADEPESDAQPAAEPNKTLNLAKSVMLAKAVYGAIDSIKCINYAGILTPNDQLLAELQSVQGVFTDPHDPVAWELSLKWQPREQKRPAASAGGQAQ